MTIKRELWFGLSLMTVILAATAIFMPWGNLTNGHLGLLMLSLVVVAIMLGFPTAFTLMGMGVFFAWLAYRSGNPELATRQTLDLMVQRAYSVMSNDVLISIPLFVFMGYLVERANLIAKLFRSLELSLAKLPGALAVATLVTCAIFATATGIVGAVVTLMGLLAFPAMLRSGYDIRLSAGAITAGGCLGILIPPSVMLIVYGATAGVSVVQLYAGAFFPGLMLAGLYIIYVIIVAKLKPHLAPPLPMEERHVELPAEAKVLNDRLSHRALPALAKAIGGKVPGVGRSYALREMVLTLLPALVLLAMLAGTWYLATRPAQVDDTQGLVAMGGQLGESDESSGGLAEPPSDEEPKEAPADGLKEPPGAAPVSATTGEASASDTAAPVVAERLPTPNWFFAIAAARGARHCNPLHLVEFRPSRNLQDAAQFVLSAGDHDPRRTRQHRLRPGDADRGSGGRSARRLRPGGSLPATHDGRGQGIGIPDRQDLGDGLLAVRRLVDLLGSLCPARRTGAGRAMGAVDGPDASAVHAARPGDHLHSRLAARMDRDHRHLHADLHPAARPLQH